ncbi:MAG: hypothetical protein Q8O84_00170, partial [Nanoarchaeota archaeon]|nr:hypothetical protein [Nanoarchaeota archaeon]
MDKEINKILRQIQNKTVFVNGAPTSKTFLNTTDSLEAIRDSITDFSNGVLRVKDVIIYPVSAGIGTTVLATDGTNPSYVSASGVDIVHTTTTGIASETVGWTSSINFEQEGTINVIGFYVEFEWQSQFTVGAGIGTGTQSKLQISNDAGVSWTNVTDLYTHANAALTTRIRAGVGQWITTITAGVNQLQFRLIHGVEANDGVSSSSV